MRAVEIAFIQFLLLVTTLERGSRNRTRSNRGSNCQLPNRLRTGAGGVVPFTASHRISFNSRGSARSDSRKSSLFDRSANEPVIGFFVSSETRGGSLT